MSVLGLLLQAASVVLNVFLLGAVSRTAWGRFGWWIAATLVGVLLLQPAILLPALPIKVRLILVLGY